jgi:putative ABC transport system ATP-binding protein
VNDPLVRAEAAGKKYGSGSGAVVALRAVSLAVAPGEFVALMGRSGCGKTTLLNLLGAMDTPTSGEIWLGGQRTTALADNALTALRRRSVGFVFQAFHLLPTLTVRENIEVPLLLAGMPLGERARELAERVELASKLEAFPHQLSGGEQQRAAIARALAHHPPLVIADEPTGNLDSHSAARIMELLAGLASEAGAAVIMATHSADAARSATRVIHISDGEVV